MKKIHLLLAIVLLLTLTVTACGGISLGRSSTAASARDTISATFGTTFRHRNYEITIGDRDSWIVDRSQSDDYISAPIIVKNISNDINSFFLYYNIWSPDGIEIQGRLQNENTNMRPGATLNTTIEIVDHGNGDYVVELLENNSIDVVITLPITHSSSQQASGSASSGASSANQQQPTPPPMPTPMATPTPMPTPPPQPPPPPPPPPQQPQGDILRRLYEGLTRQTFNDLIIYWDNGTRTEFYSDYDVDIDDTGWDMYGRDGNIREVFPTFALQNDAVVIGFPQTTQRLYYLYDDGRGIFGDETFSWGYRTRHGEIQLFW